MFLLPICDVITLKLINKNANVRSSENTAAFKDLPHIMRRPTGVGDPLLYISGVLGFHEKFPASLWKQNISNYKGLILVLYRIQFTDSEARISRVCEPVVSSTVQFGVVLLNMHGVQGCTPVEWANIYFPNTVFAILHTPLPLMLIYCR
jgi:hypothetical protein